MNVSKDCRLKVNFLLKQRLYIHTHTHIYIYSSFLGNVSISLIDKTYGKNPKRRENYLMRTLKTYAPFGLNIEDSF